MKNILGDSHLLIIYIIWVIFLVLGIQCIVKYKLWKPVNYLTILIIFFMYIIFLYQLRVFYICVSPLNKIEKFSNLNTTFKLHDRDMLKIRFRDGDIRTDFNWDSPLAWAQNKGQHMYADDKNQNEKTRNAPSCDNTTVLQLTELVVVTNQTLIDARAAYKNLIDVFNDMETVISNDQNTLTTLTNQINTTTNLQV